MKRRDGFETASDSRNESLDDRLFSKFPKFLELSEQEKRTFHEILKGAREKVGGRKKIKSELGSKNAETAVGTPTKTGTDGFFADASSDWDGFGVALSETEKEIYFATLKKAGDNTKRKKKNSRAEFKDEGTLKVAVNLISKDNERIWKAQEETRINRKPDRSEREKQEEGEDRLLLDIIGKRPEKDVSTKEIFSETNLPESFSFNDNDVKRSLSFIDRNEKRAELLVEPTKRGSIDRDSEPAPVLARPVETAEEGETEPPDKSKILEAKEATEQMFDSDKEEAAKMEEKKEPTEISDLTFTKLEGEPKQTDTAPLETMEISQKEEEVEEAGTETIPEELEDVHQLESIPSFDQGSESMKITLEKTESLETLVSDKEMVSGAEDSTDLKEKDLPYPVESVRSSFAEEGDEHVFSVSERKSEQSILDSDGSKTSGESSEDAEEPECVPIYDKKLTAPKSRVRTLQDLLKDRAVLVVDSSDRFKIEWKPKERIPKTTAEIKETALSDLDPYEEEAKKEKKKNKIIFFLEKMFACGRKETEKEDVVAENLKGESVSVEMGTRQRNAASATLDDATIEVLEAAKRKRIIAQYIKQS